MKATSEPLYVFARASAALAFGRAPRAELLAQVGLDESRWAALCVEWDSILGASPEARGVFAIAYREARLTLQRPVSRVVPAAEDTEELPRHSMAPVRRDATMPLPIHAPLPPGDEGRTVEVQPRSPALPILPFVQLA